MADETKFVQQLLATSSHATSQHALVAAAIGLIGHSLCNYVAYNIAWEPSWGPHKPRNWWPQ